MTAVKKVGAVTASPSSAVAISFLTLAAVAAWTASAMIDPMPPKFILPNPPNEKQVIGWASTSDSGIVNPPPQGQMHVPQDLEHKMLRCWGYLARGKAVTEMRAYLLNGTTPSVNTCEGVNRLHPFCWPDVFHIYWHATPFRINHLRNFCLIAAPPPPPDHFGSNM